MKNMPSFKVWIGIILPLVLAQSTFGDVAATGGTATNYYTLNGTNFTAHLFKTVGASTFTVTNGGYVEVLVVAGGGGGGRCGGGGGAGGLIYTNRFQVGPGSYAVTVGGGGSGSTDRGTKGGNGNNSFFSNAVFGVIAATGGGGAGSYSLRTGNNGGSGGGAAPANAQTPANNSPGNGTTGQGNNGGTAPTASGDMAGGGGGGASAAGGNAGSNVGGAGGAGLSYDLSGVATYYAGGGGGGAGTTPGAGGAGGGGAGATNISNATAGTANTGGGGGGSRDNGGSGGNGANGGSGIVIVRYFLHAPQLTNGVAQNITATSADVSGTLITNGISAATVYLFCATNDCMTNAASWSSNGTVTVLGPFTSGVVFTNTLSPLGSSTTYYWNLMASNSMDMVWGATAGSPSFRTYGPPAVNNGAGAVAGFNSAILNGNLTAGKTADVYIMLGASDGVWTSTNYLGSLSDTPGAFSTNATGLAAGSTYFYICFASNAYGTAWAASSTNFTTLSPSGKWYAVPGGAGVKDGSSWNSALATVQAAIDTAAGGDTIYLAGQTFSNTVAPPLLGQLVWTNKTLTILGGYAGSGAPGALTNTPTVLTQPGGRTSRILYVGGVTNGLLRGVTVTGGTGWFTWSALTNYDLGSGLYVSNSPGFVIQNCTISNNLAYAWYDGSGTYGGGLYLTTSDVTLSNCVIKGNRSNYGVWNSDGLGGGIYVNSGTCRVYQCELRGNSAIPQAGDTGRGGGICLNAGLLDIRNSLIVANDAGTGPSYGAGVDVRGGVATLSLCTLVCNNGTGVQREGGTLAITNSILWGNVMDATGTMTLAFCDVQTAATNITQNNCLSTDPQFERGLYLAAGSPCVNQGNDTATNLGMSALTTRADGTPDSGTVDLGYHFATGTNTNVGDLYVAPAPAGNNTTGNGSAGSPYATITKALSYQQSGTRVHAAAGAYSVANGETLPLTIVMDGVQLLGTNAAVTQISGGGSNQVLQVANSCGDGRVEGLTLGNGLQTGASIIYGGGLYASLSALTIASCVVTNDNLKTTNTIYNGGTTFDYGGGIGLYGGLTTITNCVIQQNKADLAGTSGWPGEGGGVAVINGCCSIVNSTISSNIAVTDTFDSPNVPGHGGGVYLNGGIYSMRNCLVNGNSSFDGSGIYVKKGALALCNVTVANNATGGVLQAGGVVVATNSIFWGNGSALDVTGTVALAWCDAGTIGPAVTTNSACLSANPQFTGSGSYTLQKTSPCIDAGVIQSWMTGALDLAGLPRIQGPRVDMGAYEAASTHRGTAVFFQ